MECRAIQNALVSSRLLVHSNSFFPTLTLLWGRCGVPLTLCIRFYNLTLPRNPCGYYYIL